MEEGFSSFSPLLSLSLGCEHRSLTSHQGHMCCSPLCSPLWRFPGTTGIAGKHQCKEGCGVLLITTLLWGGGCTTPGVGCEIIPWKDAELSPARPARPQHPPLPPPAFVPSQLRPRAPALAPTQKCLSATHGLWGQAEPWPRSCTAGEGLPASNPAVLCTDTGPAAWPLLPQHCSAVTRAARGLLAWPGCMVLASGHSWT